MEIVKVQVAIFPAGGECLVYAKGKRKVRQQIVDASVKRALGEDLKGYFRANFYDGRWHIGNRVADQDW